VTSASTRWRGVGGWARSVLLAIALLGLTVGTGAGVVAQDGETPTIRLGSKGFTEHLIITEMMALALEDAGYEVEQTNLENTAIVHQALVNDEIDAYVEYTGTALTAVLQEPAQSDPQAVYDFVKRAYAEEFQVRWLDPIGFNNTWAIAMRRDQAAELGITTISDLQEHDQDLQFGATQEFFGRPDGLDGLVDRYDLDFQDERGMDPGLVYEAVANDEIDVTAAFSTDGRIYAYDLQVLEDDLGFFPPYFAAPVVREEILEEDPRIAEVMNQLAGQIDDQTMADLNLRVDEGGEEPRDVARAFLDQLRQGGAAGTPAASPATS
jgi:glycine betaine/choline ABC-type transport system substrate-binding protein